MMYKFDIWLGSKNITPTTSCGFPVTAALEPLSRAHEDGVKKQPCLSKSECTLSGLSEFPTFQTHRSSSYYQCIYFSFSVRREKAAFQLKKKIIFSDRSCI